MKATDFSLKNQDGKSHSLSDYRGQRVILYFYPKDDTPLINPQGEIVKKYEKVKPEIHPDEIIKNLKKLQKK